MQLRGKLLLAYAGILLVPLAVLGTYAFGRIEAGLRAEAVRSGATRLGRSLEELSTRVDTITSIADLQSRNRPLTDFLSAEGDPPVEELIAFRSEVLTPIENIRNINPLIYQARMFVRPGFRYEYWPTVYSDRRLPDQEWLERLKASREGRTWRVGHVDMDDTLRVQPTQVASYYLVARDSNLRYLGILEVSMAMASLFPEIYGGSGELHAATFALFDDGRTLAAPDQAVLSPERLADIAGAVAAKGRPGAGASILEPGEARREYLVAYGRVERLGATLVQVSDFRPVLSEIGFQRDLMAGIGLLLFVVMTLAIFAITSLLLEKLERIVRRLRLASDGDFESPLDTGGRDEIAELGRHVNGLMARIRELFADVGRKHEATREAQIRSFHSQINAHFIYNTLESIRMMAEVDGRFKIADGLRSLGELLRYSLKWDSQFVGLDRELAQLRAYLDLLRLRYDFGLELEVASNEPPSSLKVLKMILQPVVENAVRHGFEPLGRDGRIRIAAQAAGDRLEIAVEDDGQGIAPSELEAIRAGLSGPPGPDEGSKGLALRNVSDRIAIFHGPDCGITIDSAAGKGTRVTFRLPVIRDIADAAVPTPAEAPAEGDAPGAAP